MSEIKQELISEIAENLTCGIVCYYNPKTKELIELPSENIYSHDEDLYYESFGELIEKIENNENEYIKIEPLSSSDSFKIMSRFIGQVSDKLLQTELENALENKRPFQNFKRIIEGSSEKQSWYDFRQYEIENIVKFLLKNQES